MVKKMGVEVGDIVTVEYIGTLNDGTVFDKSNGKPITFEAGSGQVIEGFDKAVIGMKENEKKEIKIPPSEAYGERDEALIITVPRNQFPPSFKGIPGTRVSTQTEDGRKLFATVVKSNEKQVVLDFNHPLAGKTLNFKITVVKIQKP